VTSINGKSRFLTTGEHLPLVVFSATPCWLILSAPQGGIPELLAPCWEGSTQRWRLCIRENSFGRFLTTDEPLPPVVFSASPGWLILSAPEVVCQNCWLPAEKNQLTDGDSVSENSSMWLLPLLLYSCVPLSIH
jgi:hypothetical protein